MTGEEAVRHMSTRVQHDIECLFDEGVSVNHLSHWMLRSFLPSLFGSLVLGVQLHCNKSHLLNKSCEQGKGSELNITDTQSEHNSTCKLLKCSSMRPFNALIDTQRASSSKEARKASFKSIQSSLPFFSPGLFLGGACSVTLLAATAISFLCGILGGCARAPRTPPLKPLPCSRRKLCCK